MGSDWVLKWYRSGLSRDQPGFAVCCGDCGDHSVPSLFPSASSNATSGYHQVLPGLTGSHQVSLDPNRVPPDPTRVLRRIPSESHQIPPDLTGSQQISLDPSRVPPDPTRVFRRIPSESHQIPPDLTGSHQNPTRSHRIPPDPTRSHQSPSSAGCRATTPHHSAARQCC